MNAILKRDIINRLTERHLTAFNLREGAKKYLQRQVNADEIFQFFIDGVTMQNVLKLVSELQNPQLINEEDIVNYLTLMVQNDVLQAVLKVMGIDPNQTMSIDEKTNLLIDLKNLDDPEEFEKILADTLEFEILK